MNEGFNTRPREVSIWTQPRGVVVKRRVRRNQLSMSKKYNARVGTVSGGIQAFDKEFYNQRKDTLNMIATCEMIEREYKEKYE